jgi:hypothetical protein
MLYDINIFLSSQTILKNRINETGMIKIIINHTRQ